MNIHVKDLTRGYDVVRGKTILLPPQMVDEQRCKDAEAHAFFKKYEAKMARWEEERVDQMCDDMIEGLAMQANSLRVMAWGVAIIGAIVLFVKAYVSLHVGAS
jgi:hypothetical protein